MNKEQIHGSASHGKKSRESRLDEENRLRWDENVRAKFEESRADHFGYLASSEEITDNPLARETHTSYLTLREGNPAFEEKSLGMYKDTEYIRRLAQHGLH